MLKHFICPDNEQIEILECLSIRGCRMAERCATLPYLRLAGHERGWRGITPSMAGNGPRMIYLRRTVPYAIDPDKMAWASFGIGTHGKLSIHKYTDNVLSEEKLSDEITRGIADVLEEDEDIAHYYLLSDYKTYGSFVVAKALGIIKETKDVPILENGKPVLNKSGKNKGKPKTKKEHTYIMKPETADNRAAEYQLNRYRIFFEQVGFPISKIRLFYVSRDGGTYIAKSRGIERNTGFIKIRRIADSIILGYYDKLTQEVDRAMETSHVRICNDWENWSENRCKGYCEVQKQCEAMGE